jgi:quercetin dioxygenase-like cupin family protein
MSTERIFAVKKFQQAAPGEPIRSVITQSSDSVVVAWLVQPGQRISPHVHPDGQDTWMVHAGQGQYQLDMQGNTRPIGVGDVVVARRNDVHGVLNDGAVPLEIVSVVSPAEAGYKPL